MIRFNYRTPAGETWRQKLETLKNARAHVAKYQNLMTAYESQAAADEIREYREREYGAIAGGAIREFEAAIKAFSAPMTAQPQRRSHPGIRPD